MPFSLNIWILHIYKYGTKLTKREWNFITLISKQKVKNRNAKAGIFQTSMELVSPYDKDLLDSTILENLFLEKCY